MRWGNTQRKILEDYIRNVFVLSCQINKTIFILLFRYQQGGRLGGQVEPGPPYLEQQKQVQFLINSQLRSAAVVLDMPLDLCAQLSTLYGAFASLSFWKQRMRQVEGPWGHLVSSKSSSRVWDGVERAAGRNGSKNMYPHEGSLVCPPCKAIIFYLCDPPNTWLLSTPLATTPRFTFFEATIVMLKATSFYIPSDFLLHKRLFVVTTYKDYSLGLLDLCLKMKNSSCVCQSNRLW